MNAKNMKFGQILEWETTFMIVKFLIKPYKILLVVRTVFESLYQHIGS